MSNPGIVARVIMTLFASVLSTSGTSEATEQEAKAPNSAQEADTQDPSAQAAEGQDARCADEGRAAE